MKLMLLSLISIFSLSNSYATSMTVLRCTGGAGGPQPAMAEVLVQKVAGGKLVVHLRLKNPAHPNGVEAAFEASSHEASKMIMGQGILDGKKGSAYLEFQDNGHIGLSIHNSWNRKVEYGYGAHFGCK